MQRGSVACPLASRPALRLALSLSLVSVLAAAAVALAGCGGSPPPKAPEPTHVEEAHAPPRPALKVKSELGTVDPAAVKKGFASLEGGFLDCQKKALDRVEVIAGTVKFFLRIGEDGRAKLAYLEESEIGDRETERCLVDVVMGSHWPQPDGGEAEARYGMELPLQSTRGPNEWNADKVAAALGKHGAAIDQCKGAGPARFHATMYVGPGGKVLAAGVTASSRDGAEKTDCLTDALLKMKGLPSPGSWPAKVTFGL